MIITFTNNWLWVYLLNLSTPQLEALDFWPTVLIFGSQLNKIFCQGKFVWLISQIFTFMNKKKKEYLVYFLVFRVGGDMVY